MIVAQSLSPYDSVHICFHQLLHKINLFQFREGGGFENVKNGDYVLVVKVAKELNLSQSRHVHALKQREWLRLASDT